MLQHSDPHDHHSWISYQICAGDRSKDRDHIGGSIIFYLSVYPKAICGRRGELSTLPACYGDIVCDEYLYHAPYRKIKTKDGGIQSSIF